MKVQKTNFTPIVITLETQKELDQVCAILASIKPEKIVIKSVIDLFNKLDEFTLDLSKYYNKLLNTET